MLGFRRLVEDAFELLHLRVDLAGALVRADIVIASTGARRPVLTRALVEAAQKKRRGRLLAVLRDAEGAVPQRAMDRAWDDKPQRDRCLASLLTDGLLVRVPFGRRPAAVRRPLRRRAVLRRTDPCPR